MKDPAELETLDRLIEDCTSGADVQRKIEHAFKVGIISKAPRNPDGTMAPETIEWMERHASWAKELEDLRERLLDYRSGTIEHI